LWQDDQSTTSFDVPVDEQFFTGLLGDILMTSSGDQVPTVTSLNNSRLVAFYFSAHWCPPCRRFTPMLIEAYLHLKSALPVHGLELIFVSSDRDLSSFRNYFNTMPWLAVPFHKSSIRSSISQRWVQLSLKLRYWFCQAYLGLNADILLFCACRFGVQGIPALVVLDTVSGNIIVPKEVSRSEVASACQLGDDAIEAMYNTWMNQIPEDSKVRKYLLHTCMHSIF